MQTLIPLLLIVVLLTGCSSATYKPTSLLDQLQTNAQLKDPSVATNLTDLAILKYGELQLNEWGMRSVNADVLNTTGAIMLSALSTGALAAAGSSTGLTTTRGMITGFNFLLQVLGIIKPAERNDARHEGAAMILDARGAFIEALAAKRVYHISNKRFTPQGALYMRQIGAAQKIVDKLIVGLAPRVSDLEAVRPVPPEEQENPGPEVPDVPAPPKPAPPPSTVTTPMGTLTIQ